LFREKLAFQKSRVVGLLHEIVNYGVLVEPDERSVQLSDESDEKFYETAKKSGAVLITGNAKHYPNEPFVSSPSEFLRNLYA